MTDVKLNHPQNSTPIKITSIDDQTRQLAAMAYGEASTDDVPEEMSAISSVLVRQRDARGYADIASFVKKEKSYSYAISDGNRRYKKLMKASIDDINNDDGMHAAIIAATEALKGGTDLSHGAYFWDGADIKKNYKHHPKVKQGIKFTHPKDNIYSIKESTKLHIIYKTVVKRTKDKKGHIKITKSKEEVARYDHVWESTTAIGGTIFWKFNAAYLNATHAKEYK